MSLYDYEIGQELERRDLPFYALIQAAMRRADTNNLERLRAAFPTVWDELQARYNAPAGCLTQEELNGVMRRAALEDADVLDDAPADDVLVLAPDLLQIPVNSR